MIQMERGDQSIGTTVGNAGELPESGTMSSIKTESTTSETVTGNTHQPEEPSWYKKPPAVGSQSGAVDSFVAQHAIEEGDYVESPEDAQKIIELRQILDGRKSMEIISGVPLVALWGEIKRSSEDHFVKLGYSIETQKKTVLYHLLHGSSPIPGLPIDSFDLPGGEIETLIRDGGFDDSLSQTPVEEGL